MESVLKVPVKFGVATGWLAQLKAAAQRGVKAMSACVEDVKDAVAASNLRAIAMERRMGELRTEAEALYFGRHRIF